MEAIVDLFPRELQDQDVRRRLKKFAQELDQIAAVESGGEVVVDQDVLERVIGSAIFPQDLQDRVRTEAKNHLGSKLKRAPRGQKLKWHELAEHDRSLKPTSVDELRRLGIDSGTSVERAKEILRENYPELPAEVLDAGGPELHQMAVKALHHNRTVWDCCVAHLGWWATLWVFAAVGALLIVGTATGPWGIPLLIWLIAVLGGGTAVIVMNCVLNPNA